MHSQHSSNRYHKIRFLVWTVHCNTCDRLFKSRRSNNQRVMMLFASPLFLFVFLPTVIICYYGRKCLAGDGLRNGVLLLFSYLFYLFGAAGFVLLLIGIGLGILGEQRR